MYTKGWIGGIIRDRKVTSYCRAKLIVTIAYTLIIHTLMFTLIPLNEHIKGIRVFWEYISSLAIMFAVLYIMVNFIAFIYNRFISNQNTGE